MHPPFSFRLAEKKTLQRGFSCRFAAIHLPGRARSKRKGAKKEPTPYGCWLFKYGSGRNRCGGNLPAFIRLRYTVAKYPAFMPQIGGVVASFRCTLNCPCFYSRCRSLGGQRSRGRNPRVSFQRENGEAPPVADAASRFRGSGAIGGPVQGPGIAMPRRCSEGGGGWATAAVVIAFESWIGCIPAAICRIPPHRWTAVYSSRLWEKPAPPAPGQVPFPSAL